MLTGWSEVFWKPVLKSAVLPFNWERHLGSGGQGWLMARCQWLIWGRGWACLKLAVQLPGSLGEEGRAGPAWSCTCHPQPGWRELVCPWPSVTEGSTERTDFLLRFFSCCVLASVSYGAAGGRRS